MYPLEWLKLKDRKILILGGDMEQRELWWNATWCHHFGKKFGDNCNWTTVLKKGKKRMNSQLLYICFNNNNNIEWWYCTIIQCQHISLLKYNKHSKESLAVFFNKVIHLQSSNSILRYLLKRNHIYCNIYKKFYTMKLIAALFLYNREKQ